jgi:hypothetical protein
MFHSVSPERSQQFPTTLPGGPDAPVQEPPTGQSMLSGRQLVEVSNTASTLLPTTTLLSISRLSLGGGTLTVSAVEPAPQAAVAYPREVLPVPPDDFAVQASALATVRSGQALAVAWREMLQEWTARIALGLRAQMSAQVGGNDAALPDVARYETLAAGFLAYDLTAIVACADLHPLMRLHEPLPRRLRDAVMDAADVEVIDQGRLDDAQIELADIALAEIYCLLQQPAARALVEGKLGELFAALHTRVRSEHP